MKVSSSAVGFSIASFPIVHVNVTESPPSSQT